MEPIYAGLMAWGIELAIAALMLLILKKEEDKVLSRRNKD